MTLAYAKHLIDLYKRGYYSRMTAINAICDGADNDGQGREPFLSLLEPLIAEEVRYRASERRFELLDLELVMGHIPGSAL